ncbi:MAG: DUF4355 domain-containing protein [Eubacteriales bacterium]|nr:DUF4355 domain-containing protein [Eubacteriales bacterium]
MNEQIQNIEQPQDSTQQGAPTQPEENGGAGKMFTQEDVNRIVSERLARDRANKGTSSDDREAGLNKREAELQAREARLAQMEIDNLKLRVAMEVGLPLAMASRLTGDDEDAIRADANELAKLMKPQHKAPPMRNPDAKPGAAIAGYGSEMSNTKHKPKRYEIGYYDD